MDKTIDLEEIQNTFHQIYIKNLNFLKSEEPNIYQKIIEFEQLNIENYSIDFVDNRFDLIDIKNKRYFYNEDPFANANHRIQNFDFSSAFSLIKLEPYEKRVHYENEINAYENINQFISNIKITTLQINKFIFIGTLLGVHINDFHKSIQAKSYLIIEPNLEIFRLSMFMTDYTELTKTSKVFFAIEESEMNLEKIANQFLDFNHEFNNLIHYELSNETNSFLINKLSLIFTQSSEMRYPFSEYLITLKRSLKYIFEENQKVLNLSKKYDFLENKKVLFLGAGVSLAKNLEWLYLNQDNFIIVASSAVLKHLQILEIVPDIIILIDGQNCMLEQFEVNDYMYKNSIILSSIKLDEELYNQIKNTDIYFLQSSIEIVENFDYLSGVTVGDIGVDILSRFGANEIYLLGIDAAIDSKNGKTHVGTHKSSRKIDLNKKNDQIDFQENIVYVKGNLKEQVPTFIEYTEMIECLNETLKSLKGKIKVYNLSDGAYLENSIPTKFSDLKLQLSIDKFLEKENLKFKLELISTNEISEYDKRKLLKENEILKKLKFSTNLENLDKLKKEFPSSFIINIFNRYFELILPYYNFLENKDLSNKILEKQIEEILNYFNTIFDKIDTK